MYESNLAERYVRALIAEVREWAEIECPLVADTIYFGGGTPSLLTPAQIERILKAVHDRFEVVSGAEVTMEMNPATIVPASSQRNASAPAQQANSHNS